MQELFAKPNEDMIIGGRIIGSTIQGAYYKSVENGARVEILPDPNTGIVCWNATPAKVFEVVVGGTNVGDVTMGLYASGAGAMWDQSAGTFSIKGAISASSIDIGTNAWHVDTSGNMWWGSSATYAGATIKISSAGSIDFTTGTFSGTLSAAAGTLGAITIGTNAWHVDINGNMWWGSASTYATATISISTTGLIKGAVFNASTGARISLSDATNQISIYSSSGYISSLVGLDAECRLRMEQAGGYVTLYAQNDANSAVEVLRADGDAGVSIQNSLVLNANKTIVTIASGANLGLTINNAGSGSSLDINQTSVTNTDYLATLDHAGTGNGVYISLNKTTNSNITLYVAHAGTGYLAAFMPTDNTNRTKASVYIEANSGRGAHLRLLPIAVAPSTPTSGDIYMNTDGVVYVYSLTGWAALNVAV